MAEREVTDLLGGGSASQAQEGGGKVLTWAPAVSVQRYRGKAGTSKESLSSSFSLD
jgi:hypothetical protein